MDNNFLAQESLKWAVENGHDLILLLLDFEKTFDKIEWNFLFPALSKLRFSSKWIKWVPSLYWLTSSLVKVNGESEGDFRLSTLVRQGYMLAPYIFILAMDVDMPPSSLLDPKKVQLC